MGATEWAEKMPRAPRLPSPTECAYQDLLARLHQAVATHCRTMALEFQNLDTSRSCTVAKDEFRAVCRRHVQVLPDEQFDRLWAEMPLDSQGRLNYQEFLSRFSSGDAPQPPGNFPQAPQPPRDSPQAPHPPGDGPPTPHDGGSCRSDPGSLGRAAALSPPRDTPARPRTRSQPRTPLSPMSQAGSVQNSEALEEQLRKRMQSCWQDFLRDCKNRDPDHLGHIPKADFLALAEKHQLGLSSEESQRVALKHDPQASGHFAYWDFVQSYVLLLRAQGAHLQQRLHIQNARKMKEAGTETWSFYSALLRIQPRIMRYWRPMRRTFKSYDRDTSGFLSVGDFCRVLRQYNIDLSDEELFHVLGYYDQALTSRIPYNDFLCAFLQ